LIKFKEVPRPGGQSLYDAGKYISRKDSLSGFYHCPAVCTFAAHLIIFALVFIKQTAVYGHCRFSNAQDGREHYGSYRPEMA
jgi:hypothetical protein